MLGLLVVSVSPEPDLVDVVAPISRFPTAANNVVQFVSFDVAPPPVAPLPVLVVVILIFPPALKNHLIVLAFVNVTECSTTCVPYHVDDESEVCFALEVVSADAFGEPAATDAANVAKFVIRFVLIAIGSPADLCAVESIESFV